MAVNFDSRHIDTQNCNFAHKFFLKCGTPRRKVCIFEESINERKIYRQATNLERNAPSYNVSASSHDTLPLQLTGNTFIKKQIRMVWRNNKFKKKT